MIPASAPSSDPPFFPTETEGSAAQLLRRASLAGTACLAVGLGAYVTWVRPPSSYDAFAMMAIGAAILASALVLWRSFFPAPQGPVTPPAPEVVPLPTPRPHVEGAFVCSKCGEYTPAPDWEAMLRAMDAPKDLEGRGEEKPAITPTAAPVDPIWPRWQPATAALTPPEHPAPMVASPYVLNAWGHAFRAPEQEPEQIFSEAELGPVPAAVGGIATSGGQWSGPSPPASLYASPVPLSGPEPGPDSIAPETFRSGAYLIGAVEPPPPLDRWISDASKGPLSISMHPIPSNGGVVSPFPDDEESPSPEPPATYPCATCRSTVVRSEGSSRCPDCHRPICESCRGSAVKHHGDSYCSPCAVNRMGTDLLRSIEDPIPVPTDAEPLDEDLGVRPAHPGGRRSSGRAARSSSSRPRRSSAASRGAPELAAR